MAAPKKYQNPYSFSFQAERQEWKDFTLALQLEENTPTAFFTAAMREYVQRKKSLIYTVRQVVKTEQDLKGKVDPVIEDNATQETPMTMTVTYAQTEQPVDTYLEEQKKRFGERFTDEELEEYTPEALEIMAKFDREELTRLVAESKNGKKALPSAVNNEAVLAVLKKLYNKESDGSSAITWALPPNK